MYKRASGGNAWVEFTNGCIHAGLSHAQCLVNGISLPVLNVFGSVHLLSELMQVLWKVLQAVDFASFSHWITEA